MSENTRSRGRARGLSLKDLNESRLQENVTEETVGRQIESVQKNVPSKVEVENAGIHISTARTGLVSRTSRTRPLHIDDKKGTAGTRITCVTSFVQITAHPNSLSCYHVTFNPAENSKWCRKKIILPHLEIFGQNSIFDGTNLYTPNKLFESLEVNSSHPKTNENVKITVQFTNELSSSSTIFNLCNQKVLEFLGYRQIGAHYYNPDAKADVKHHRSEIYSRTNDITLCISFLTF